MAEAWVAEEVWYILAAVVALGWPISRLLNDAPTSMLTVKLCSSRLMGCGLSFRELAFGRYGAAVSHIGRGLKKACKYKLPLLP